MQSRQRPEGGRSGWWHRVGMRTPASFAAVRTVVPLGTTTSRPSIVAVTIAGPAADDGGTGVVGGTGVGSDVVVIVASSGVGELAAEDLGAEVLDDGQEHVRAALAEAALGRGLHGVAEFDQVTEALGGHLAASHRAHPLEDGHVPDAARGALAAGLVHEELHEVLRDGQQVPALPEHDEGAPGGDVLVADGAVEGRGGYALPRRPADDDGHGVLATRGCQHLPDRHAEGELVHPGSRDVPGHGEELRAGGTGGADRGEPLGAAGHDGGDPRERLDVVHDRWGLVQPADHREREAVPGLAAAALEALDEGRLLAADVGAGAEADGDVEVEAGAAEDGVAEEMRGAAALDARLEALEEVDVLAAEVEDPLGGADRVAGYGHALEHEVREVLQQRAVLECAGLALIRVADDEAASVGAGGRRGELPLQPGGETRTAATLQAGATHPRDDILGAHHAGRRDAGAEFDRGQGHGRSHAHRAVSSRAGSPPGPGSPWTAHLIVCPASHWRSASVGDVGPKPHPLPLSQRCADNGPMTAPTPVPVEALHRPCTLRGLEVETTA